MKVVKFDKIFQFRHLVETIKHLTRYKGMDENKNVIYDDTPFPKEVELNGNIKLHGENVSVRYDNRGLRTQSKEVLLSNEKDLKYFNKMVMSNSNLWLNVIEKFRKRFNINFETHTLILYGEYVGLGVQKKVAISNLENKSFFFISACISPIERENMTEPPKGIRTWYDDLILPSADISHVWDSEFGNIPNTYSINNYKKFKFTFDVNDSDNALSEINKLVDEVEKQCPVALSLGFDGLGEGIVWRTRYKGVRLLCKSKGEKHSSSRDRYVSKAADVESVKNFIDITVTKSRLEQAMNINLDGTEKNDGQILGKISPWIKKDILEEEADIMKASGLTIQMLSTPISKRVAKLYFDRKIN